MTKGDLWWDTKKHRLAMSARAYGAKQLAAYSLFQQSLESYHCSKCKLVLFKYREKKKEKVMMNESHYFFILCPIMHQYQSTENANSLNRGKSIHER